MNFLFDWPSIYTTKENEELDKVENSSCYKKWNCYQLLHNLPASKYQRMPEMLKEMASFDRGIALVLLPIVKVSIVLPTSHKEKKSIISPPSESGLTMKLVWAKGISQANRSLKSTRPLGPLLLLFALGC